MASAVDDRTMDQLQVLLRTDQNAQAGASRPVNRRAALTLIAAGGLGLMGVGVLAGRSLFRESSAGPVDPRSIAQVEAARRRSGTTTTLSLTTRRAEVDLGGGRVVTAMTYGGELPGPLMRATAGDLLNVDVRNDLDQQTSVHWHGLAIRNDMDGVPGLTTDPVDPGQVARYSFVVPDAGTYWFHPHTGLQLDWGLYAPLIIDSPTEPGAYDHDLVVVLDDWTVGVGETPEQILARLKAGGGTMRMGGMQGMGGMSGMNHSGGMGDMSSAGGAGGMAGMSDAGDVEYPLYLANGRIADDPTSLSAKAGQRVRVRVINAAADTIFDVAVARHRLTVTHSDGFALRPVEVDTVRVGMGERYDFTLTLADGVFPLTAMPLGKTGTAARVLLRTSSGTAPAPGARPAELDGRRLLLSDMVADPSAKMPAHEPDTHQDVVLAGDMSTYRWTINGQDYDHTRPLTVRQAERTRLTITNASMMSHPVHLHGHTFAVRTNGAPRKDTVLVPAMGRVQIDVEADNPGQWMLHCHNAFHMDAGMMTRLDYSA